MMDSVRVLLFLTCGVLLLWVGETLAQTGGGGFGVPAPPPGAEGTVPELEAWQAILEERYIAGRELAGGFYVRPGFNRRPYYSGGRPKVW